MKGSFDEKQYINRCLYINNNYGQRYVQRGGYDNGIIIITIDGLKICVIQFMVIIRHTLIFVSIDVLIQCKYYILYSKEFLYKQNKKTK